MFRERLRNKNTQLCLLKTSAAPLKCQSFEIEMLSSLKMPTTPKYLFNVIHKEVIVLQT